MRKTKLFITIGIAVLLIGALSASAVLAQGSNPWPFGNRGNGWNGNYGSGMMGNGWNGNYGSGMMGNGWNGNYGSGMMGGMTHAPALRSGAWAGVGHGNWGSGPMDPGQDCPFFDNGVAAAGAPQTLDEAQAIAEQYLASYGNDDLEIAEIMQFSENFYVEVHETSTGIGAMELLIDTETGAVHPEPGPNMMWNTEYGHMAQGGMMGGWNQQPSGDMTVTADEAIAAAQTWLDANMAGVNAGDEAEPFYGYYTIHTLAAGEIGGMLSVNGYTGQVWYHSWHGDFVDMTGELAE